MTTSAAELTALVPFEEVYRCHAGGVHRYCVSQVWDRAAAEDLTHLGTLPLIWGPVERPPFGTTGAGRPVTRTHA